MPGSRGPIGKSVEEHQLQGTYRADRHGKPAKSGEVSPISPLAKPPVCPSWLSKEAKAVWRQTVPSLFQQGRVCVLDTAILAAYCVAVAHLQDAERELGELKAKGEVVMTTARGGLKAHPLVAMAATGRRQVLQLSKDLGLTPASRARLPAPPIPFDEEDSPLERLIGRADDIRRR